MAESNEWGLSPAITLDGVLHCPRCGGEYLHHGAVTVLSRVKGEDGDGVKTTVRGVVNVEPVAGEDMPGRRDSLSIAFWCEVCPDGLGDRTLHLTQHKGQTIVYWGA